MFQASTVGILGLSAITMCFALAAALYFVGTKSSVARKLALLLVVEGITLVTAGFPFLFLGLTEDFRSLYPQSFEIQFIIHTFGDCAMLALYPPFLAAAIQTKLTRPFAGKRMRIGLAGASVTLFIAVQLSPLEIGATLLYLSLSLLFSFSLVVSIHAWRVAPPGMARARAGTFALAFGFRDVCWGIVYGGAILAIAMGTYLTDITLWRKAIYALGTLLAVPVISYGILRTQLFDIDLRIRWTIKQSTVAAVFVAIFYLVSEGADRLLASEFGNIFGLLASAIVVLFLAPLQRFAERVASVAMPNTENTPEYAAFRKMQVYEAAVAEAQLEGGISHKERALLVRLRDSLGITVTDAEAIEGALQAPFPK